MKTSTDKTDLLLNWAIKLDGYVPSPSILGCSYENGGIGSNAERLLCILCNRANLFEKERQDGYFYLPKEYIFKHSCMDKRSLIQARNDLIHYGLIFVQMTYIGNKQMYHYKINVEGIDIFMDHRKEYLSLVQDTGGKNLLFSQFAKNVNAESVDKKYRVIGKAPINHTNGILFSEADWEKRNSEAKLRKRILIKEGLKIVPENSERKRG